jgi:hypothetical protein
MKRSEMEKLLLNGLCDLGQWYDRPPEQVASALCVLLKPTEGWEPEEPVPEPEWPEQLYLTEWGAPERPGRSYISIKDGYFTLPNHIAEEVARRWEAEPKLQAETERLRAFEDEALGLRHRIANVQRCADRSNQLVDRWKGVVEKALTEARSATPSFERILAILEERNTDGSPESDLRGLLELRSATLSTVILERNQLTAELADLRRQITRMGDRARAEHSPHGVNTLLTLLSNEEPPEGFVEALYNHSEDETDASAPWRWMCEQVKAP